LTLYSINVVTFIVSYRGATSRLKTFKHHFKIVCFSLAVIVIMGKRNKIYKIYTVNNSVSSGTFFCQILNIGMVFLVIMGS
jgi:hypothetical protein